MKSTTFNKLLSLAENYIHLSGRMKKVKKEYRFSVRRQRNLDHLNERKVPIPLSLTLDNLIVDQKIGRFL